MSSVTLRRFRIFYPGSFSGNCGHMSFVYKCTSGIERCYELWACYYFCKNLLLVLWRDKYSGGRCVCCSTPCTTPCPLDVSRSCRRGLRYSLQRRPVVSKHLLQFRLSSHFKISASVWHEPCQRLCISMSVLRKDFKTLVQCNVFRDERTDKTIL